MRSGAHLKWKNSGRTKGLLVLKFAGVDSISEAENLVGCELQVRRASARSCKRAGIT